MDLPHAVLSFLSSNQPHSPNTDDPLTLLFSSPATDIDDTAMTSKLSSLPTHSHSLPSAVPDVTSTPILSSTHPTSAASIPNCHQPAPHSDTFLPNLPPASTIYDPSLSAPSATYPLSFLPPSAPSLAVPSPQASVSNTIPFSHAALQPYEGSRSRIQSHTYQSSQPIPENNPNICFSPSSFALASASLSNHSVSFPPAPCIVPRNDSVTPTPISPLPNSLSMSLSHSCGTANQSTTTPQNPKPKPFGRLRRVCRRDRSLEVMKSIAANSAPDVSLSDGELLEIGTMHESESQLGQSREVYESLSSFKSVLLKHGYRLTALHLDTVSEDHPNAISDAPLYEPFDFVLNKNTGSVAKNESMTRMTDVLTQRPDVPDSQAQFTSTAAGTSPNDYRDHVNNDHLECGSAGSIAGKRRRVSGNGSSNSSGEHDGGSNNEAKIGAPETASMVGAGGVYSDEQAVRREILLESAKLQRCVKVDDMNDMESRKRTRSLMKGESAWSEGRRLGCVVCGKIMSDIDTVVRHFRHAHQELKPFSCPRCRGFYSSEGTLWHHIRNVHTETPRKYRCSFCDASYDSFGAKTRHEHATHSSGSSQFVCSYKECGRAFNFPAHLEAHALQMHPGFRPFACDECPKSFPSANGLTRHAREVHQRPQAYSCSCKRSYSKRCHLKRHLLRVHGMSVERVQEEMKKQPHPGLLHMVPRAPPASTD